MGERVLVLMRHAKSDWSGAEPDRERPIGRRGRRQAAEAGAWLARHLPDLDLVVTSPARRARSTWETAATAYGEGPAVRVDERVYTWTGASMLAAMRDIDDDVTTALLVGHEPGIGELLAWLTGEHVPMVTSALAVTTFTGRWRDLASGSCALTASGRPPP